MSNFFTKAQNTGRETMSNAAAFAEGEIGTHQRMAWTPVIAGALTGLVAQLVLSLFGLGIGLSTAPGVKSFSIIAGIWLVLSAVVANGIGGFMAARVGGGIARSAAGYQGLVTWALTTVICLVLLTSAAGSVVGGAFGAITGAFGGAGSAISVPSRPLLRRRPARPIPSRLSLVRRRRWPPIPPTHRPEATRWRP